MPEEKNISESIELIKDSQKEQYLNQNFHSGKQICILCIIYH